ncbi:ribonuclease R family protein [Candidatus Similichlamydia epinepheli]|uniref:ribonuclease R family protein n=1 Tax=Candidatus Similichlamydia epinepheli TaxID=1903953 RepID=UPI000D33A6EE|nr:ribonuclease R family protein [Candidatus Similichlamydia epinepheli]
MKQVNQGVKGRRAKQNLSDQITPEDRTSFEKERIKMLVASTLVSKGPLPPIEIVRSFKFGPESYEILKEVLHSMVVDRTIGISADDCFFFQGPIECEGRASLHVRGFGFVSIEGWAQDVFVPKCSTEGACNRDLVRIVVVAKKDRPAEGKILSILERGQSEVVGTITSITRQKGTAYSAMLQGQFVQVKLPRSNKVVVGDRILIQMKKWSIQHIEGEGVFVRKLGHIDDASKDIEVALTERSIRSDFPKDALEEAELLAQKGVAINGREDFTKWETITIDPSTAKDFDDALSIRKNRAGGYRLGVHIADVAHYVPQGGALDREARLRGNSTYLPNHCVPMLPPCLADDLCSLRSDVKRLTVSVIMNFDSEGTLLNQKIVRSIIQSKAQLSYEQAREILDKSKETNPYFNQLKMMVDLCMLLKKKRRIRGAVDMNLDEVKVICNEKGEVVSLQQIPYDITHQMVEEFMVKTNEVVALHLSKSDISTIYRAHEPPSEEAFKEFLAQAESCHFSIPRTEDGKEIDVPALLSDANQTPFGRLLTLDYIRSMKMAFYQVENIGHFGLRLTHYCHFTSPIRRYSDLVVIRSLFGEIEPIPALQEISKFISGTERNSAKAEQGVLHLKKLRMLSRLFSEGKTTFFARICKVRSSGLVLELLDLFLEIFLHISLASRDFLVFDEENFSLSSRNGTIYRSGDTMEVELVSIDLLTQKARWKGLAHYSLDLGRKHPLPEHPHRKKNPRRRFDGSN